MESVQAKKILIVEDIPMNSQLVERILGIAGFATDIALNGEIAIQKLQQFSYQLVLMDIMMPVMDGFEATRYIRNQISDSIPIIALTAITSDGIKEECDKAGMNGFLNKPIRSNELLEEINRYLSMNLKVKPVEKKDSEFVLLEYLMELSGGDKAFILDMVHTFISLSEEGLKELFDAVSQQDAKSVQRISHRLKSTVSMMNFNDLANQLSKMEKLSKLELISEITKMWMELEEPYLQAIQTIKDQFNLN